MSAITAFAIIALSFSLGDFIAMKTKGIISTFITVIILFVIFGGVLQVLPSNLVDISGLSSLIPTFGMALILTNLGSSLDINDLKNEWKTILIALGGLLGIVALCSTVGRFIFGFDYALSSIAPISGGIVATMISTESANLAGKPEIALFVACVMAFQMLVGLPIASFSLKKAVSKFVSDGNLKDNIKTSKKLDFTIIKKTPSAFDNQTSHFARLALVAGVSQTFCSYVGLNTTIGYILFGTISASLGIIERNSLKKAGGDGILLLATYVYVVSSFLTVSLSEFAKILIPALSLLLIGALGICIISIIVGKLLKTNPFLSIAIGISCMFGYPVTYAVASEVCQGVSIERNLKDFETEKLIAVFLPKMIVSGVVSVSIVSVIIAEIISPIVFGG